MERTTPPPSGDCGEQTARTRILREAVRLFGQQGYAATSVREVVEAAGVTKPTLYYYFRNKEDLYREAVELQIVGLRWLVDRARTGTGTVRQRLREFLVDYVHGAIDSPDSVRLMMASAAGIGQPRVDVFERTHAEYVRLEQLVRDGIDAGELRSGVDPSVAVSMLVGAANAAFFGALLGQPVRPDHPDRILELLYGGIAR